MKIRIIKFVQLLIKYGLACRCTECFLRNVWPLGCSPDDAGKRLRYFSERLPSCTAALPPWAVLTFRLACAQGHPMRTSFDVTRDTHRNTHDKLIMPQGADKDR